MPCFGSFPSANREEAGASRRGSRQKQTGFTKHGASPGSIAILPRAPNPLTPPAGPSSASETRSGVYVVGSSAAAKAPTASAPSPPRDSAGSGVAVGPRGAAASASGTSNAAPKGPSPSMGATRTGQAASSRAKNSRGCKSSSSSASSAVSVESPSDSASSSDLGNAATGSKGSSRQEGGKGLSGNQLKSQADEASSARCDGAPGRRGLSKGRAGEREGKVSPEPLSLDPRVQRMGVGESGGSSNSSCASGTVERDTLVEPKVHAVQRTNCLVRLSYRQLELATDHFSEHNLLGEGGFGPVFQGMLPVHLIPGGLPGTSGRGGQVPVAVKLLKVGSHQGDREWLAEVSYLGQHRHRHLVRLLAFCNEGKQRALVYELMPQGSLEFMLFAPTAAAEAAGDLAKLEGMGLNADEIRVLTWHERVRIAVGAAKGLAYLHEEAGKQVIYRDLKTSNILLDDNLDAKLSDFGLARDGPEGDRSHVSTRIVGTVGYAAPEYVMTGHLTIKSDVWAFGVVLLELLTGRLALDKSKPREEQNLVDFAEPYLENPSRLYRIMDPLLRGQYSVRGAQMAASVARACLQKRAKQRPKMSVVAAQLEPVLDMFDIAGIEIGVGGGSVGPMGYAGSDSDKEGALGREDRSYLAFLPPPVPVAAAGRRW